MKNTDECKVPKLYERGYADGINGLMTDDSPRREFVYEHGYFEGNRIRRSALEFVALEFVALGDEAA